ncbi:hypothetical protein CVT24_008566 [Panaeolus cyanescens]|uniref:Uncharacterized protein n=1 Tax=Panaeolus cyanescens TaxID=181874 RepID=A0A409VB77_9AGAR|nr:hypothetical protein CVT24_008566 [Panaeolus cyanescens]
MPESYNRSLPLIPPHPRRTADQSFMPFTSGYKPVRPYSVGATRLNAHASEVEELRLELSLLKQQMKSSMETQKVALWRCDVALAIADSANPQTQNDQERSEVKTELEYIKGLAEVRAKELAASEVFLTKANLITISELIEVVKTLNEEIFKAAAYLGENIVHETHSLTVEEEERMYQEVEPLIGTPLAHILREESRISPADPLLVQTVIQIFLVNECRSKVEMWCPNDVNISKFIQTLYANMQRSETLAVCGRWRALAQKYSRPLSTAGWSEQTLINLAKVIKLASWTVPEKSIRTGFEKKLEGVFKAIKNVRIALGEKMITSENLLYTISPDAMFIPECMEDFFCDRRPNGSPQSSSVAGTVGFGLKMRIIPGRRGASSDSSMHHDDIVLFPKVALHSTLLGLLPPSPDHPIIIEELNSLSYGWDGKC